MSQFTQTLEAVGQGHRHAAKRVTVDGLRRVAQIAARQLAREKPGHTLQPTALVHEAWLRLGGSDNASQWAGRTHFLAAAAQGMRRILVESARRK